MVVDAILFSNRRQTLAFKGFLVSCSKSKNASGTAEWMFTIYCSPVQHPQVTIYGLVTAADEALLSHEHKQRLEETHLRREARIDLARRGMVATETEISKWKAEREAQAGHPK